VHSWSTFGAKTSHGQTWTHKIHHGLNLGEATTFPLIVYFVPLHEAHIQMTFCLETPKWESQNSQSWDFRNFGAHNFVCRPSIEMKFKAKIVALVESFPTVCCTHLHTRKLGRFPTFGGWESNCQFDFQPFLWP